MKLVSTIHIKLLYSRRVENASSTASDSGDGAILPTWTSVDAGNVRTMRELMEGMRKEGWNVDVSIYTY
jgi:hypothetical protein